MLKVILLAAVIFCSLQLSSSARVPPNKDPVGFYFEVNGKQYFWGTDFIGIPGAFAECEIIGMSLTSFASSQEYSDLIDYLRAEHMYEWFWTSGVRDAGQQQWYWNATQQPFTDTFWAVGQPNDQDSLQSCMQFTVEPDSVNLWYDKTCEDYINFLCD